MEINSELAKELIIDHYENPSNKIAKKPKGKYSYGHNDSPSCIDNIDGYVLIKKGKVEDAKFSGIGCAICTSSTDLLVEEILGKPVAQVKKIISNYLDMILGKKHNKKLLGKLIVYQNVNKQANRVKCAMTGIQAIQKAIENYEK